MYRANDTLPVPEVLLLQEGSAGGTAYCECSNFCLIEMWVFQVLFDRNILQKIMMDL